MSWSKVRHSVAYDPTTANLYDDIGDNSTSSVSGEEEDLKLRPTLIYTLTKSLSDFLFRIMLSSAQNDVLDVEEVRNVMLYRKDESDLFQLMPKCWRGKADDSEEQVESNENDEHCEVSFLSLYQHYGLAYRLRLSLQKTPMDISQEEARKRQIPDERGWTKPIHDTDIYVSLLIYTPDYSEVEAARAPTTNKNVGQKQRETKKKQNSNQAINNKSSRVDDILARFLHKTNAVLESYIMEPTDESPLSITPLDNPSPLPIYVDTSLPQYQYEQKKKVEKQQQEAKIISNPYCVEYQITQVDDCLKLIDFVNEEIRKEEEALQKLKQEKERQKQLDLNKDNQYTSGWGSANYYGEGMEINEDQIAMMEFLTRESLEKFEKDQHELEQEERNLALEEEMDEEEKMLLMEEEIMRSDVDEIDEYELMIQEVILQRRREEEEKEKRRKIMSEEEEIMLALEEEERKMMEELRMEQQKQNHQSGDEL